MCFKLLQSRKSSLFCLIFLFLSSSFILNAQIRTRTSEDSIYAAKTSSLSSFEEFLGVLGIALGAAFLAGILVSLAVNSGILVSWLVIDSVTFYSLSTADMFILGLACVGISEAIMQLYGGIVGFDIVCSFVQYYTWENWFGAKPSVRQYNYNRGSQYHKIDVEYKNIKFKNGNTYEIYQPRDTY